MSALEHLNTLWTEFRAIARILPHLRRIQSQELSPSLLLQERAEKTGDAPAILFEDQVYTWHEINAAVDKAALAFQAAGLEPGASVAFIMDNRPEFLIATTALNRIGATVAMINTQISGQPLAHAISVVTPDIIFAGAEHVSTLTDVMSDLEGLSDHVWIQRDGSNTDTGTFHAFDALLEEMTLVNRPVSPGAQRDGRFGYIYTSGTTGLPKAAVVTNRMVALPGVIMGRGVLALRATDVIYMTTPLFHSVGMFIGWSGALTTGAAIALSRRFSASRFWDDIHHYRATVFIYVGELCRYLLNQPPHPLERKHQLRIVGGNGLRPDIWQAFKSRFEIPLIREYYGATEGNTLTLNLTGRVGMVGRMLPGAFLIRCDIETGEPFRGSDGRCVALGSGSTGLLISRIRVEEKFAGYLDESATRKKFLKDVFEVGDCYFNSGDLLTLHDHRWLSFADRLGDTFRWKGENVSTNEVAEILNGAVGVRESNVYGVQVPGSDGRAGMAAISHSEEFSLEDFAVYVCDELPGYMRPLFLRLQQGMDLTATFKHTKAHYRTAGFNPDLVDDALYVFSNGRYMPIDAEVFSQLQDGTFALR